MEINKLDNIRRNLNFATDILQDYEEMLPVSVISEIKVLIAYFKSKLGDDSCSVSRIFKKPAGISQGTSKENVDFVQFELSGVRLLGHYMSNDKFRRELDAISDVLSLYGFDSFLLTEIKKIYKFEILNLGHTSDGVKRVRTETLGRIPSIRDEKPTQEVLVVPPETDEGRHETPMALDGNELARRLSSSTSNDFTDD